ncbi:HEAT repeat domain-containing protein [Streptomyces sp. NPDC002308]
MTPESKKLVLSLVTYPGTGRKGSPDDVLRHFGTDDGSALGLRLLLDAVKGQDATDVEMALIVAGTFGLTDEYLEPLIDLVSADWHYQHEDIVSLLAGLRTPRAVEALYGATQWVPDYLAFDDSRALAVKAVWGLARTPGPEAKDALTRLLGSDDDIVREQARARLGG